MSAACVMSVQCNWCSKARAPFRAHRLASNQVICDYCLDWHNQALLMLAGGIPVGCQRCQRTWIQLQDEAPGSDVRMYVVPKDGIYQLLCAACVKPYLPKRADLYAGTKFGRESLKI